MERGEYHLEGLPLREYNALQGEVVRGVSTHLKLPLEECFLVCSGDFRELVLANPPTAEELTQHRANTVARLQRALLERYQERHSNT